RASLSLQRGELIAVYAMLVISAPLMTQGMWHRLVCTNVAIPHKIDHLPLVDRFSDKLWPHGEHLIDDRRFENVPLGPAKISTLGSGTIGPNVVWEGIGRVDVVKADQTQVGPTHGVMLRNIDTSTPPRTPTAR